MRTTAAPHLIKELTVSGLRHPIKTPWMLELLGSVGCLAIGHVWNMAQTLATSLMILRLRRIPERSVSDGSPRQVLDGRQRAYSWTPSSTDHLTKEAIESMEPVLLSWMRSLNGHSPSATNCSTRRVFENAATRPMTQQIGTQCFTPLYGFSANST